MYKAAIFDFDGTLAHTLDDVVLCMRETFAAFRERCPSATAVREIMGIPLDRAFAVLRGRETDTGDTARWVDHYRSLYALHGGALTRLYPGVKEVLDRAADAGIRSIVVSNKGCSAIDAALRQLRIAGAITRVFAADTVRYQKPDPRLYVQEIRHELAGIADAEVLVVGDSESDLRFARNANLTCCWAAYGYGSADTCLRWKPDIVIHSFDELAGALFGAP